MELKKFREYQFTENTEALVKDCWYKVYAYKIHFGNENHNRVHIKIGKSNMVNYTAIQALREKPKEPEKPVEIYINIYKDNRVEIACDLEQAKRLESINDMRSRDELLKYFKGVKTDYDKYQKTEYDKEGWAAEQTEIGLIIYFYGKKMYHINEYKSDIKKYYILELLYEAEEPEKPKEIYVNVYKNGAIEKLDTMIGNGDTELICAFRGVKCSSSEYHKPENWRPNSWRMRENEQGKYRIFKGHQSGASHSYSSNKFMYTGYKYYILELLYDSEQAPEISNSVLKDYLPPKQENVFSKEQYAEIYKLISAWFHSFIKKCELITKEQVK